MNLNQLKYFKAVGTYGSVSAAAHYLHISQPSVSNAIKELEEEFGLSLFKRTHHGMVLTSEGEELMTHADKLIAHSSRVERAMEELGAKAKTLRVGIPPMIGSLILPKVFNEFLPSNPDVCLDITEAGREELVSLANDEFLDMLILPHLTPFDSSFECVGISRLETVCCVSKKNPLKQHKTICPNNLKDEKVVLFKKSFFQRELILKWFSDGKTQPNIIMESSQLSTIENLIANNVCAGFLFKELIGKKSEICPISLSSLLFVDVSLVWKKHIPLSGSMIKFKNFMINNNPFIY